MPTLIERIRELTNQIRAQEDTKVSEDEAKGFRTRAKELSDPSNAIIVPTRRLELFKTMGIPVEVPLGNALELKKIIDKLSTNYASDPRSILGSDPSWRYETRNQLAKLANRAGEEATRAWQKYLADIRPPVNQGIMLILRNSPSHAVHANRLQELNTEFNELMDRLPTEIEEINRPEELAEEMRLASENLPPDVPEPVQELFRSMNAHKATAADLTDEALTWLRENDLLESLLISWRDT
jgi:ribosome recycling factor